MKKAFIYARVSSGKQVTESNGIGSQIQRCKGFIKSNGYKLVGTFTDDGVSGAKLSRSGIQGLLKALSEHVGERVVVIDDISRLARDVPVHMALRSAIARTGATVESPNMSFEDTPEGEFLEYIMAANAQLARKSNRKQVINRQTARLEMGYWSFHAPLGYHFEKSKNGKILTSDLNAHILAKAFEAYASGSLFTKRAMAEYLAKHEFFPKIKLDTLEKKMTRIFNALPLYAGYIEYPKWGVAIREGNHEPIISRDTYHLVLKREMGIPERLGNRTQPSEDFVLRNFVRCPHCGYGFTASFAKPNKKCPRYYCRYLKCSYKGKTVKGGKLDSEFEELLKSLEASDELMKLIEVVTKKEWVKKVKSWDEGGRFYESKSRQLAKEVEEATKRLLKTTSESVIAEIENRLNA